MSKKPVRPIDRAAMAIVGLFLLGFFLGFERFLAGSWRAVAASFLSMIVWFGGAFALDAGLRRAGRITPKGSAPVWLPVVFPVLGAAAGVAYSLTATGRVGRAVLFGAVAGGVLSLLSVRERRRARRAPVLPPVA